MMNTLEKLMQLSAAEEFFIELGVDYDPAVVNVARLHILRRMGQYLGAAELDGLDELAVRAACRDTLERAYADFLISSPIAERLFRVHQDAIKPSLPPEKPFVPLSALTTISTGAV
jgi:nitrogenase-stabilizing/protective protein